MSDDDGWLNGGLPFIDHVFDGKTGRQIVRENLKRWAIETICEPSWMAASDQNASKIRDL